MVTSSLIVWAALYVNERIPIGRPWTSIVYACTLLSPSIGFWLIARYCRLHSCGARTNRRSAIHLVLLLSAVGIALGFGGMMMIHPANRSANPALISLLNAAYVSGLVMALATMICSRVSREYILHNRILGRLAVMLTGGLWSLDVLSRFGDPNIARRVGESIVGDIWFLATLLAGFLCVLNVRRSQTLLGVATLLGASTFMITSRVEVFLSMWSNGAWFWPLVILIALSVEAIILRWLGLLSSIVQVTAQ